MAAERISDGLGGFVVEGARREHPDLLRVAVDFEALEPNVERAGCVLLVLTGICVGAGTILFFLLFQKGGPLSAVPMILAGGAAINGGGRDFIFQGSSLLAETPGHRACAWGLFLLRNDDMSHEHEHEPEGHQSREHPHGRLATVMRRRTSIRRLRSALF